jgi:hypothetical protein
MLTSAGRDVPALICANEAWVTNKREGEVAADRFMELLESLSDDSLESSSVRWAVVIREDGEPHLHVQLQCLPSDAVSLSGRPATKG